MTELKTYSVLIAWSDEQDDEGSYGTTVRAANAEEAEAMARQEMAANDAFADEGQREFGSVLEITEGAIWKAAELEKALRGLLDAMPAPASRKVTTAWDAARAIIADIDAL